MQHIAMNTGGIRSGVILDGRYRICESIGEGGFGEIFKAVDISPHGNVVAVKANTKRLLGIEQLENVTSDSTRGRKKKPDAEKPKEGACDFIKEFWALKHLEKYPGFPKAYTHGIYQGQSYMVMEMLGKSVGDIFEENDGNMTLTNVLLILDQCLVRIKNIHEMGMVHGDIKPDNMMMGIGENSGTLYFIDFGLVSSFWDWEAGKHVDFRDHVHEGGTPHFMAVDVHKYFQKSRKDDLETLGYVLAFILKHKRLPWQQYIDDPSVSLAQMKKETREDDLFHGYPMEFAAFLHEVRNLKYDDTPDYEAYREMFRRLGVVLGINYETDVPRFQ